MVFSLSEACFYIVFKKLTKEKSVLLCGKNIEAHFYIYQVYALIFQVKVNVPQAYTIKLDNQTYTIRLTQSNLTICPILYCIQNSPVNSAISLIWGYQKQKKFTKLQNTIFFSWPSSKYMQKKIKSQIENPLFRTTSDNAFLHGLS